MTDESTIYLYDDDVAVDWTYKWIHHWAQMYESAEKPNKSKFTHARFHLSHFNVHFVKSLYATHWVVKVVPSNLPSSSHAFLLIPSKALIQMKSNLVYFECLVLDNFSFTLRTFRCCFILLHVVAVAVCVRLEIAETYWTNILRRLLPKKRRWKTRKNPSSYKSEFHLWNT